MHFTYKILFIICVVLVLAALFLNKNTPPPRTENNVPAQKIEIKKIEPIEKSDERVTKKPFGVYFTPKTSPVQPEHFTGFHTGTDFEILPGEENIDVPIYAICNGKLLQARTATGYGGVLVQACNIDNQDITVVYGHIRLSSISKKVGETFAIGEKIAVLGTPPSETSGERKHLHLGIHKGTAINILGYVQNQSELNSWLDFQKL